MKENILPSSALQFEYGDTSYIAFRLKNGDLALNSSDNIICKTSNESKVELVTLESDKEGKLLKFWKIAGKYYTLITGKLFSVDIPINASFGKVYYIKEDLFYLEYISKRMHGIARINSKTSYNIIPLKKEYDEIEFDGGVFYAHTNLAGNKYLIISETGYLIWASKDAKYKKVNGYYVFYSKRKIIFRNIERKEVDFDEDILDVKVFTVKLIHNTIYEEYRLATRVAKEGSTSYYIFGSKLIYNTDKENYAEVVDGCLLIYEKENGVLTSVKDVLFINEYYHSSSEISCNLGIQIIPCDISKINHHFYKCGNKVLFTASPSFMSITENADVDEYSLYSLSMKENEMLDMLPRELGLCLVGFKNGNPYNVTYFYIEGGKEAKGVVTLKIDKFSSLAKEDTFICKAGTIIFVACKNSNNFEFMTRGSDYTRKCLNYSDGRNVWVYEVDMDDGCNFKIYEEN